MKRCFICRGPLDTRADTAADIARIARNAKLARAEAKEWRERAQAAEAALAAHRRASSERSEWTDASR